MPSVFSFLLKHLPAFNAHFLFSLLKVMNDENTLTDDKVPDNDQVKMKKQNIYIDGEREIPSFSGRSKGPFDYCKIF